MVTILYSGRLGNNLFQYVAAYIFSRKFNFKINSEIIPNIFDLPLADGIVVENPIIEVDDSNFMSLLESESINDAHYEFVGYYQLKNFILNYRDEIKSLFNLKFLDTSKNKVFVAYRIGDLNGQRHMLPIEYYREALSILNIEGGFISSDTPDHPNVIQLKNEFNLEIYDDSPINTINFAKNFNNLVLSEGTFSWWIGFLSKAKNVYYNERPRRWHGDIFVIPEWKHLQYDYN